MNPDYARALEVLAERGARDDCPICNGSEWDAPGHLGNLIGNVPLSTPFQEAVRDDEGGLAAITAYVMVCANCGFVRLHSAVVLDGSGRETSD
jgi:hypothetical protein